MDGKQRAEELIAEERERKTGFLDLGMLGLTEIPRSLRALDHLISLNLGSWYQDADGNRQHSLNGDLSNEITSVAAIAELPRLRELYLCGLPLDNLYEVAQIISLEALDCPTTRVSDLSPIHALSALQSLNCYNTKVSDLSPIHTLSALQSLNCSRTRISELSPVQTLGALQSLACFNTQVSDLSPIRALSALQSLDCSETQVSDLSPIHALSALRSFDCSDTRISDLTPLQALSALQTLYCASTQVSDLTPLQALGALQSFACSDTQISDLTPLQALSKLQSLYCSATQVSDLTPLQTLSALQTLYCSSTKVSDLAPLQTLSALQTLYCYSTRISDLSPLKALGAIQTLDCSDTKVSDLTPLQALSKLQAFDCSRTQVSDLSPLTAIDRLITLSANGCELDDFPKQLLENRALQYVTLQEARIPGIPQEILSQRNYDNCLQRLRDHVADLSSAVEPVPDVKLIVLGNGKVGKTQICRRLLGQNYDESVPSTHGITIDCVPLSNADDAPLLNIWDFGGQEIYHGTHALFMATRAVFLLAWHPEFERNDEVEEDGGTRLSHRSRSVIALAFCTPGSSARCSPRSERTPKPPRNIGSMARGSLTRVATRAPWSSKPCWTVAKVKSDFACRTTAKVSFCDGCAKSSKL